MKPNERYGTGWLVRIATPGRLYDGVVGRVVSISPAISRGQDVLLTSVAGSSGARRAFFYEDCVAVQPPNAPERRVSA